jgi:hypothetical protein
MKLEAGAKSGKPDPEEIGRQIDLILESRPDELVVMLRKTMDRVHRGLPEAASGEFLCTRLKW